MPAVAKCQQLYAQLLSNDSDSALMHWFTFQVGRDFVQFTDDNAEFTPLKAGRIPFIADAGLDKPQACFNKFVKGMRTAPAKVHYFQKGI